MISLAGDIWRSQMLVGLLVSVALIAWLIRKVNPFAAFVWALFTGSAIWVSNVTKIVQGTEIYYIGHSSSQAALILCVVGLLCLALKQRQVVLEAIAWVTMFNALAVGALQKGLLYNAHSFDLSIAAMMWPYLTFRRGRETLALLFGGVIAWATLRTGGSTPWLVMAASLGGLGGRWILAGLPILGCGYYFTSQFLNDSGRFERWEFFYRFIVDTKNHWVGMGVGSFEWLGPQLERMNGRTEKHFMWMHNEYLQVFFETGVVGLVVLVAFGGYLVGKARQPHLLSPLLALGACSLTQFPMRWYLSGVWCALLVMEVLNEKVQKSRG